MAVGNGCCFAAKLADCTRRFPLSDMQIVGNMLVRNEDVFIERAIRNVVEFCDKIIITNLIFEKCE